MAMASHPRLRTIAWVLFLGYVLLLVAAGAWGIVGARLDMPWLLGVDVAGLSADAEANLLSQYRFLRAMELGFGLFALRFRREIFTIGLHNRVFLLTMAAGVAARLLSLAADGLPNMAMRLFLAWELVGVLVIGFSTRAARRKDTSWEMTGTPRMTSSRRTPATGRLDGP